MNNAEKLPTDIKFIWFCSAVIDLLILLGITGGIFIWKHFAPVSLKGWLSLAALAFLVISLLVFLIELALITYHWNFWTYYIDESHIELHHGFFFRKQIIIPIARVQNVTLNQGPILRMRNLQKIEIVTAAGSSNIAGLKSSQADTLKELIMELAQEARNDL